jgi:hypothetical protein
MMRYQEQPAAETSTTTKRKGEKCAFRLLFSVETQKEIERVNEDPIKKQQKNNNDSIPRFPYI